MRQYNFRKENKFLRTYRRAGTLLTSVNSADRLPGAGHFGASVLGAAGSRLGYRTHTRGGLATAAAEEFDDQQCGQEVGAVVALGQWLRKQQAPSREGERCEGSRSVSGYGETLALAPARDQPVC